MPAPANEEQLAPTRRLKIIALLGFIVALLALPVVLALGGPWGGWVLGFALWCVNWTVGTATTKRAMNSSPTLAIGLSGLSFVARAWTIAIVLFVVAIQYSEPAALAAAGTFLVAFTADLVGRAVIWAALEKQREPVPPTVTTPTTAEDE